MTNGRADFYVGRGKDANWLGVSLDGYPDGIPKELLKSQTEGEL